ncbi:RNase H domain-containing protein [Colletotrichum falcatum]|nr:RNase H domain-containing protein [Colletotrichum falcatum]
MAMIDYVDLPNGRTITVCAPHRMVTGGRCCLDFSFDISDGDVDSDDGGLFGYDFNSPVPRDVSIAQDVNNIESVGDVESDEPMPPLTDDSTAGRPTFVRRPKKTKHSGIVFPSTFSQQGRTPLSPEDLFPARLAVRATDPVVRFINRHDDSEFLIYTDGACLENGSVDARGGCAVVFKPSEPGHRGSTAFKLEDRGADGQMYRHTSNRAELRAVVAALRYRSWDREGFNSIVIATDSTYVVNGATTWTRAWVKKGWQLATGEPVKNRDLWEALLLDVEKLHDLGVSVRFWKIPRQQNRRADKEAKRAASELEPSGMFRDINGVLV